MKLLHTADWHLGQTLAGHERTHEHRLFLQWLLRTLQERQTDALLIAGDVFDQASPPAQAQALYYDFLAQARRAMPNLAICIIAGNHDSPSRLQAPRELLAAFGMHVIGRYEAGDEPTGDPAAPPHPCIVPLRRADGRVGALALAVPFLRPGDMPAAGSHAAAVRQTYTRLAEQARALLPADAALIVMGHLHAQGGAVSEESERPLIVGGEEALPASVFPPQAAYVALGHLHKPQQVGAPHIRYSGSPLPLSFSEVNYPHQVLEITLSGAALADVQPLPVPRPAQLLRVPARPAPLPEMLQALREINTDDLPAHTPPELLPLVQARLLEQQPPADLRAQVDAALAGKRVRLAGVLRERAAPASAAAASATAEPGSAAAAPDLPSLADLQRPHLLFERLLQERAADWPAEQLQDVRAAFAQLRDEAAQEQVARPAAAPATPSTFPRSAS